MRRNCWRIEADLDTEAGNQTPMSGLRREVLRPRQAPGRLRALRGGGRPRSGCASERRAPRPPRRRRTPSTPPKPRRGPRSRRPRRRAGRANRPQRSTKSGAGCEPANRRFFGSSAMPASARRRWRAISPRTRGRRGFRGLHGQGRAGDALERLRRRLDDPCADLSRERRRGGRRRPSRSIYDGPASRAASS